MEARDLFKSMQNRFALSQFNKAKNKQKLLKWVTDTNFIGAWKKFYQDESDSELQSVVKSLKNDEASGNMTMTTLKKLKYPALRKVCEELLSDMRILSKNSMV